MASFRVYVAVFVDDILTLNVKCSTTIHDIITMIPCLDKGSDDHLLLFNGRNLLHDPLSTAEQVGIEDQAELIVSRKGLFSVRVRSSPWFSFPLLVGTLEKVVELKAKICGETGIPMEKQDLYYCHNLMGDDESVLAFYGIVHPGNTMMHCSSSEMYFIDLHTDCCKTLLLSHLASTSFKHQPVVFQEEDSPASDCSIFVDIPASNRTNFLRFTINVSYKDTIANVKMKIRDKACNHEINKVLAFIPEGLYVLLFNGKCLEDESSTLHECGIKDKDRIVLCPRHQFKVTTIVVPAVKDDPKIQVYGVDVRCYDTVGTLKEKIKGLASISCETNVLLRYQSRCLVDDNSCLVEHGIVELPFAVSYSDYLLCKRGNFIVEAVTYCARNC